MFPLYFDQHVRTITLAVSYMDLPTLVFSNVQQIKALSAVDCV